MSVEYSFRETDYGDKYGGWIGKYTIGHISCRGTRVWFRPPYTFSYSVKFDKEELDNFRDILLSPDDNFPGDDCNLRTESLNEIVENFRNKTKEPNDTCCFYDDKLEDLFKSEHFEFESELCWKLESHFEEDKVHKLENQGNVVVFYDMFPTEKVWLTCRFDSILEELENVYEKCEKENVTWKWI